LRAHGNKCKTYKRKRRNTSSKHFFFFDHTPTDQ
jgi:hypothetical protein